MKALKDSLVMSLSLLPANALVGLITFGTMVGFGSLLCLSLPVSGCYWLTLKFRPKSTNLDTLSVRNHTCSGAIRIMLRSRSRKCSVWPALESAQTCPRKQPVRLLDLQHGFCFLSSRLSSRSQTSWSSCNVTHGPLQMTSELSDARVLHSAWQWDCSRLPSRMLARVLCCSPAVRPLKVQETLLALS